MALPRIGNSDHAPAPPSSMQQQAPAPAAPTGKRPPPGRPLPPTPVGVTINEDGGGGGFERQDDAYWSDHPLQAGTYDFWLYVNKLIDWGQNGITVTMRVSDWDRDANRPRPHHGRDIDWPQNKRADMLARMTDMRLSAEDRDKAARGFAYFRRDLVTNYVSLGRAEESWEKDEAGNPTPPYYDFFTLRLADGMCVPLMLRARIVVQPKRQKWPDFRDMRIAPHTQPGGTPVQAPMPFEVTPYVADVNGWRVTEERELKVDGRTQDDGFVYEPFTTTLARVARDAVPLGHAGMPTYKDI